MARQARIWASLALALLGVAGIAIGAARGEVAAYFQKAVVVCMECIGIG
ncbi:MAG: thioredoxin [Clostridiales bacterium]|nr:thioredoxin [Clostridiales bacterium]